MTEAGWREALAASPLSWPLAEGLARLPARAGVPPLEALQEALGRPARVRFVRPAPRPRGRRAKLPPEGLYDARITVAGEVPTRPDNLHDLMNALVWAAFPESKRALHARQARLVRARVDERGRRLVPHRTAEEDALAMLDEGGVVLLVSPASAEPVRHATLQRDAGALAAAAARGELVGLLFGHALYEHLARGASLVVWAKAVLCEALGVGAPIEQADAWLARQLAEPEVPGHDCGSAPLLPSVLGARG